MKSGKKFVAILLAICMVVGLPISVSATGTTDQTEFRVAQAVVIPEEWGVSTSVVGANKGILPYFTGGPVSNIYKSSVGEPNTAAAGFGMTSQDTLYTGTAVTIVAKGTNWAFPNKNESAICWKVNMDINDAVSSGPNNYFGKLAASMDTSLLPDLLSEAQKAKYTSAIDTMDEIFMLAEDLGGDVQFRMWERGNFCKQNGIVESYYHYKTKVQLTANIRVNDGGFYNGKATDTNDCMAITVTRVGVDTLDFLSAEFIEDENSLRLTFREGLNYSGRGNNATYSGMAVLNTFGQVMYTKTEGGETTYKTEKEVADGKLAGYTALKYDTDMVFERAIYNGSTFSVNKCFLTDAQVAAYRNLQNHAQALKQSDAAGGYQLCYIVQDKKIDAANSISSNIGESTTNHFVDAVWGTKQQPLYANYTNADKGVIDTAAQPIVSVATAGDTGAPLTLKGVFINPKQDHEVILTFSEPIKIFGNMDVRVYPIDENMDNAISGGAYWPVKDLVPYGNDGNQLKGTLKTPDGASNQSMYAVINAANGSWPGKTLKIAVWDSSSTAIPNNGYVDRVMSLDGNKRLVANRVTTRDVALSDFSMEPIAVESITVLNDNTLRVKWTDGIVEGEYRSDDTTWKSIRITNDNLELQKNSAGGWMQYGGTWTATEDPSVWYFTVNGMTFSTIASMIGEGGEYAGLKATFAIEQLTNKTVDSVTTDFGNLTNLLDNITSVDGVRPVTATNDSATGWLDGSYTVLDLTPTPMAFTVVGDKQIRITTAFAGRYAGGAIATDTGLAALSVVAQEGNDKAFIATFAENVSDVTSITVAAGAFANAMGASAPMTLTNNAAAFGQGGAAVTLDEATTYTFTNADTGREITFDGVSDLRIEVIDSNKNLYAILAGDRYLDLTGGAPLASDKAIAYQIVARKHDRYMIYAVPGLAVSDTDEGTDTEATLKLCPADTINAGWYVTAAGQTKPIRLLPIGDSITYGTVPSGTPYTHGWRDSLSEMLSGYLNVPVVLVGSKVSMQVNVDSDMLYRHEGNPGWTVKDHPKSDGTALNGIYDLVPGLVSKYDPDVVCMMIGINDMSVYASGGFTDDERDEMKANYRDLVKALAVNMDSTDTIFCSRLTPLTNNHSLNSKQGAETFNDVWGFNDWISEWAAEGLPVSLNDNYAALAGKTNVVSSDGIHLNANGDSYVAQAYFNSFVREYDAAGIKYAAVEAFCENLAQADAGETVALEGNFDLSAQEGLSIPADVTLDLNGHTLTVSAAAAVTSTSAIIDSSNGRGGIKVAKDQLLFVGANTQLPLYDAAFGGYRFFECESEYRQKDGETGNSTMFGMHLDLSEQALALLADKESAGIDMIFHVESDVLAEPIDWVVRAETLADYAAAQAADPDGFWVVVLTISGLDSLQDGATLNVTASLVSTTTATLGTATLDYVR